MKEIGPIAPLDPPIPATFSLFNSFNTVLPSEINGKELSISKHCLMKQILICQDMSDLCLISFP